MNHDRIHKLLSTRSSLLDALGHAGLRFFLYRENAYFHPDYNGEHHVLNQLKALGVSPRTIFDIGANVGRWSSRVHSLWPDAQIHMFDPVPSVAAGLERTFAAVPQMHVHNCAVGAEDGTVDIHENLDRSSHSFVTRSATGEGKLVSGASAFKLAGADHVELVKLDTEGFDLDIIHGFEPQLRAAQISFFQFEHHTHSASYGRQFGPTTAFLRDLGYRVGKIFPDGLREVEYGRNSWAYNVGPNFFAAAPDRADVFEALLSR